EDLGRARRLRVGEPRAAMKIRAALVLSVAFAHGARHPSALACGFDVRAPVDLVVGHSYSSASALRQPATFALVLEEGRPVVVQLAAGVLARGPAGRRAVWEVGVRAGTGSARPAPARSYGALLRASALAEPWILSLAGEYEADGRFDVEKGTVGIE